MRSASTARGIATHRPFAPSPASYTELADGSGVRFFAGDKGEAAAQPLQQRFFEGGLFEAKPGKYGYRLGNQSECETLRMVSAREVALNGRPRSVPV